MVKITKNPDRSTTRPAHFLITTVDDDVFGGRLSENWRCRCKIAGAPFITIHAGKQTAMIRWDYTTLPESLDDLFATKEGELVAGFRALVDGYGRRTPELLGGARSAEFKNIAADQAEGFAEALFDLVTGTLGLAH